MNKLLLFSFLVAWGTAAADTRYVTDQFKVTMRSGESASHKIVRMVSSGTALEVLADNPETGYSQVRTGAGTTGYVLTRQLMPQPNARDRLARAEVRLRELQEEPGKLSAKLARLQEKHQKLNTAHKKLQGTKNGLERELETLRRTAANAIRISNERNKFRESVVTLTRDLEDVKQKNRDLENQTTQRWFMIGAGVIILGIILGLLLPHLRFQRRKSSWGSL